MKILLIGGNGTIGKKINSRLIKKHQVIIAGRTSGDVIVDIADTRSIQNMFEITGKVDAVVCVAGEAKWSPFADMTEDDFFIGIKSKLMGQVNLVRIGKEFLNPKGSFTLTTGILAEDPVIMTTSAAMVNGAVHSFVKAVSMELENGLRINAVAAGIVEDAAEKYADFFPGHNPVAMEKVVNGYVKSIEGKVNGQVIRVYE